MRRARCGAAPVCTTAGPTTAMVSLPCCLTWRSSRATSRTICALGFSLLTAEAMNSNGWLVARSGERQYADATMAGDEAIAGPGVAHRHGLCRATGHIDSDAAVHLGVRDAHPLALDPDEGLEVGGGVEGVGEHPVHLRGRQHHVLRLDRDDSELGDRRHQLVEVRGIAAEDAHHGM